MSRRHRDNLVGALLVLCVATPIVWWTGDTAKKTDSNEAKIERAAEASRTRAEIFCVVSNALGGAGGKSIAGSVALPGRTKRDADRIVLDKHGRIIGLVSGRFARFLEQHGYPLAPQRLSRSREAAQVYIRALSTDVARKTGRADLIKPDGTLDCKKLQQAPRVK